MSIIIKSPQLTLLVPKLKKETKAEEVNDILSLMLDRFLSERVLSDWMFWYYTPMAYSFAKNHIPCFIIYDCMDELSAFKFAPVELISLEKKLMEKADLVFTGGHSLFNAKKSFHTNIYPFPSSIDKEHFGKARGEMIEPNDQKDIKGIKLGFFGVIDERFDINLIRRIAEKKPEWQLILIGPIVKISEDDLPRNNNIHYLGQKCYSELPAYLSHWHVALIPFLLNESTRYISPTKTPEYLAAGKPVISTPIRDVIDPYGVNNLVHICGNYKGFINAVEQELEKAHHLDWLDKVDKHLENLSWENTVQGMNEHILNTMKIKNKASLAI